MNRFIKTRKGIDFMKFLEKAKKFFGEALKSIRAFFGKVGRAIKEFFSDRRKLTVFIVALFSLTVITVACIVGFNSFVSDYYHADADAITAYGKISNTDIYKIEENILVFNPKNATTGFIFYPGGKVEYAAYTPLMDMLASKGILCVLIEMPYNLAFFDVNAADGIAEKFPEIESWYIGGHSLGGSMAAIYLDSHGDEIDGLVLLGSYSTVDITDSRVLSVYGSEDKIMNRTTYRECKKNLPDDFTEVIIDGGNHAAFGMYGIHDGDGYLSKITTLEQIEQTANAIFTFINEE